MDKLQLLNSPEECKRRLEEVPVVNPDPSMDPRSEFNDNAGELDEKKQGPDNRFYGSGIIFLIFFSIFNLIAFFLKDCLMIVLLNCMQMIKSNQEIPATVQRERSLSLQDKGVISRLMVEAVQ